MLKFQPSEAAEKLHRVVGVVRTSLSLYDDHQCLTTETQHVESALNV